MPGTVSIRRPWTSRVPGRRSVGDEEEPAMDINLALVALILISVVIIAALSRF